jgi:hypothetical protein
MADAMDETKEPLVRVFISYAHEDHKWKKELRNHLGGLTHSGQIDAFSDEQIPPGDCWDPLLRKKLDEADIIILLISANFLGSSYCMTKELRIAMGRHRLGAATVIPVIVSECDWAALPINKIQCFPKDEHQNVT